jgi:hypothetical protein
VSEKYFLRAGDVGVAYNGSALGGVLRLEVAGGDYGEGIYEFLSALPVEYSGGECFTVTLQIRAVRGEAPPDFDGGTLSIETDGVWEHYDGCRIIKSSAEAKNDRVIYSIVLSARKRRDDNA